MDANTGLTEDAIRTTINALLVGTMVKVVHERGCMLSLQVLRKRQWVRPGTQVLGLGLKLIEK